MRSLEQFEWKRMLDPMFQRMTKEIKAVLTPNMTEEELRNYQQARVQRESRGAADEATAVLKARIQELEARVAELREIADNKYFARANAELAALKKTAEAAEAFAKDTSDQIKNLERKNKQLREALTIATGLNYNG